jgi:hypothetical protein
MHAKTLSDEYCIATPIKESYEKNALRVAAGILGEIILFIFTNI